MSGRTRYNVVMDDLGEPLIVEASDASLPELLKRLREDGRTVQIVERGTPIAELSPLPHKRHLPPVDPRLKATFAPGYDPTAPLDESDWPEHLR